MRGKAKYLLTVSFLLLPITIAIVFLKTSHHQTLITSRKSVVPTAKDRKKKSPRQTQKEISLIAVGDISYSRGVERIIKKKANLYYPFLKIANYLKTADVVFGNLETPITSGPEMPNFSISFRSNPGTEQALKQANFSILSLANNHIPDFGPQGLLNTLRYLEKANIKYAGAGENNLAANKPVYITRKGIKLAFLAYNDPSVVPSYYEAKPGQPGTAFMRLEPMTQTIRSIKTSAAADFIIVSMHAGVEYAYEPNQSQIKFAHAAIDAGADLVIGHHPHVVQTMEQYKGKFIFYSLGNFIFDQPQRQITKEALTIRIHFTRRKIKKIELIPVVMINFAQPATVNGRQAKRILARLNYPLDTENIYSFDRVKNKFRETSRAIVPAGNNLNNNDRTKEAWGDLNNNSILENYLLKKGKLVIYENEKIIWQSPSDWKIDNFILADSNNDGASDINLSLWRAGNFGASKPFWIKKNDMSIKNHFFLLNFIRGKARPIWGSSNLSRPNCEFRIADIDDDKKNELIVIEGDYRDQPRCRGKYIAVWRWNGWGFTNEWRSRAGLFSNLEIERENGKNYIIVDEK